MKDPIEGLWLYENNRNAENSELYSAIIREAYDGVKLVVAGHHLIYTRDGHPLPEEIPSADTLIFDHHVAQKLWKADWKEVLMKLALEPVRTRDALLHKLYYEGPRSGKSVAEKLRDGDAGGADRGD